MGLQRKTTDALREAGIDFDTKPFSPHLTIDRVKSPKHVSALLDGLEKEEATGFGSVEVSGVLLFKSVLKPGAQTASFCPESFCILRPAVLPCPPYV